LFLLGTIVHLNTPFAQLDNVSRGPLGLLLKDFQNQNRIFINPVEQTPYGGLIDNPKLVTALTDRRERSRRWHRNVFPLLQPAEKEASFKSRGLGKRRSLDFAVQPDKRLLFQA